VEPCKTKIIRFDLLRARERSEARYGVGKNTKRSGFDLFKTPGRPEVRCGVECGKTKIIRFDLLKAWLWCGAGKHQEIWFRFVQNTEDI